MAYARELQANAARFNNPSPSNPHYQPFCEVWCPTDEYARHLSAKLGPVKALAQLEGRADANKRQLKLEKELDAARLERERKRRQREREEQGTSTSGRPGQRIDRALAQLELMSQGKTTSTDQLIVGGAEHPSRLLLERNGEELTKARSQAVRLAVRVEAVVDRLRRSPLPPPKIADRDEALRAMIGYKPEHVAQLDPRQGLPRQIRERRSALGLDEETGERLGDAA